MWPHGNNSRPHIAILGMNTHTHTIFAVPTCLKRSRSSKKWKSPDFGAKSHLVSGHHLDKCESPPNRSQYHVSEVTSWVNLGSQHHSFRNFWGHWISRPNFFGAGLDPWAFPDHLFFGGWFPKKVETSSQDMPRLTFFWFITRTYI